MRYNETPKLRLAYNLFLLVNKTAENELQHNSWYLKNEYNFEILNTNFSHAQQL